MFLLLITSRIAIRLFSFNKILLFIKKLAFDGFYPLLVVSKNRFLLFKKNKKISSQNKKGPIELLYAQHNNVLGPRTTIGKCLCEFQRHQLRATRSIKTKHGI